MVRSNTQKAKFRAVFLNTDENRPTMENEFSGPCQLLTKKLDAVYVFASIKVQTASACPRPTRAGKNFMGFLN